MKNKCLVEGCIEEINDLINHEFNSYWGRCYKDIVLIDYFAKQIKFPIFKYKIRIWNKQAKKINIKLCENECFYNFDLEVTELAEKTNLPYI